MICRLEFVHLSPVELVGILEIGAGGSTWVGSSHILSPYTATNSLGHKITCLTANSEGAMGSANETKTGTRCSGWAVVTCVTFPTPRTL